MRTIPMDEFYKTAEATSRMFPGSRWAYVRSALRAATILTSRDLSPDDRAYHQRVRDINLGLVRSADSR